MAFDGAAQFALSRAPPEVVVTTINPVGSDTAVVASEGVAQSMPPAIHAVAPRAGRMEEDMVEESSVIMMVVGRTRREPPLALLPGGSRSPMRGELLLQWMAAEDPSSALFSLDDATESLEQENLDIGFLATLNALNEASGALHEILAPSSRVFA